MEALLASMAVVIALHLGNLAAVFRALLPRKPCYCLRHVTTVTSPARSSHAVEKLNVIFSETTK